MPRIEADLLIPGFGDPIKNGCVVFEGKTISYAGPIEGAPPDSLRMDTDRVPVVMPGLWECHGHFLGIKATNVEEILRTPVHVLVGRATKDVERALQAGITNVRDVGGLGIYLARLVEEGTLNGPRIYAAGAVLSQTGGHGDVHAFPLDFVTAHSRATGFSHLCDGVPECLKAVRAQLRLGAKLIKVLASGGVASELDNPVHQQFSDEELRAIVLEAARAERIVAAHCHGKPGIVAALNAGCKTIEHGTFLDDEAAESMIERDTILVPTRFILEGAYKHAKEFGMPDYMYQKLGAILGRHKEALKLAVRKRVRIAMGTDIITTGASVIGWGNNAQELLHLVDAGMTPLQALEAATANGPLTLGPQAPRSGQLREGYDADLIALARNPIQDLVILTDPDNIIKVWRSGKLVKDVAGLKG